MYRTVLLIVSLLVFNSLVSKPAIADDEAEIRSAFFSLQQAFLARDSNQALGLISSDTKDYYRMLSKLAANSQSLEQLAGQHLTPLNLMMLKYAKSNIPKSFWIDMAKSNPDKLLKLAVDKGLGSKELTDNVRLGKIELSGVTAAGKLVKGTQVMPVQLGFQKEAGQWKVSLLSMFEQANNLAEKFLKKSGLKIEDLEKMVVK